MTGLLETAHDCSVISEVDPLLRVLLHRPGREFDRITPSNAQDLLFDETPWAVRAGEEHDAFAAALRAAGAEVIYVRDALETALADEAARQLVIEESLSLHQLAFPYSRAVYDHLLGLSSADLAEVQIAGLTFDEVPGLASWSRALMEPAEFLLPPLPNQVFMRDSSAVLYGGVHLSRMRKSARYRESLIASLVHEVVTSGETARAAFTAGVEGGDILVAGGERLLIGVSERSGGHAAITLATQFLTEYPAGAAILVPLPRARWAMHLDTILTMIDHTRFLAYGSVTDELQGFEFRRKGDTVECSSSGPLRTVISQSLGASVEFIQIAGSACRLEAEQWNDAYNVLAIAPNVVVAYARNQACNEQLASRGIEIVPIVGSELGKGRGGPRCMSCPVLRQA